MKTRKFIDTWQRFSLTKFIIVLFAHSLVVYINNNHKHYSWCFFFLFLLFLFFVAKKGGSCICISLGNSINYWKQIYFCTRQIFQLLCWMNDVIVLLIEPLINCVLLRRKVDIKCSGEKGGGEAFVGERNLGIWLLDFCMFIIYSGAFEVLAFICVVFLCALRHEYSIKIKILKVHMKMKIILSHMRKEKKNINVGKCVKEMKKKIINKSFRWLCWWWNRICG